LGKTTDLFFSIANLGEATMANLEIISPNDLSRRSKTGNCNVATQNGNIYASESMIDSTKIPSENLGCSTMARFKNVDM